MLDFCQRALTGWFSKMRSGPPLIFDHQSRQNADGGRPRATFQVSRPDFERDSPLRAQRFVSRQQAVPRVVDVRGFRSHAVKLDDLKVLSLFKFLDRWCADIEPAEVEPLEPSADLIEDLFQAFGLDPAAVEKDRAPAVRPQFDQLHALAGGRRLPQPVTLFVKIEAGHTNGPLVLENEPFESALPVADHHWKALLGGREDLASVFSGDAVIEDAEFGTRRVFLNDRIHRGAAEIITQFNL